MIKYRSNIEEYYSWWLDELKSNNLIKSYEYEKQSYSLFSSIKDKESGLKLGKCSYTPDFWVYCTEEQYAKLKELNIPLIPTIESITNIDKDSLVEFIIEIKPKFNFQNKNELAKVKIKWLYQKEGIYINMVHPTPTLFSKTFTPQEYLLTDTKKSQRKIDWDIKSLTTLIDKLK